MMLNIKFANIIMKSSPLNFPQPKQTINTHNHKTTAKVTEVIMYYDLMMS